MAATEQQLWWYRSLHHLVLEALLAQPNSRALNIVDAGCGTGGLLMFLRQRGFTHLAGFDISPDAIEICRQRELPVKAGDLREFIQVIGSHPVDAIISNDTLCYFTSEEQFEILCLFWKGLVPSGWLLLNLPALPAFRGIHDLSVGIQQRFTKEQIITLLSRAGFTAIQWRYWPFLLSPLIYLVRLSQRCRMRFGPAYRRNSDIAMPPCWLNTLLERVTRLENRWIPWKPFGSSLFLVARAMR